MGVKPTWRSSSWSHESCFARTVEVVSFQQHIFACSVDKVSRNWLMDVFKYTQCILPFLFRDSLTCIDGISGRFEFKDIQWLSALHAWFARSLLKVRVSLSPIKLEKNEWNKIVLFDSGEKKKISRHQTSPYNTRGQTKHRRSDEGLTLETSAFESLYGGQLTLSTQLIKPN